jgi:hypothetical protein
MTARPIGAGAALAAASLVTLAPAAAQEPRFKETVQVERVLVDARVVDARGRPIQGLTAKDFRVEGDGKPARVESAHWVSASEPYPEGLEPEVAAAAGAPKPAPGRLIVFFFQKSLDSSRVGGLIKLQRRAAQLLDTLGDEDTLIPLGLLLARDRLAVAHNSSICVLRGKSDSRFVSILFSISSPASVTISTWHYCFPDPCKRCS